MQETIGLQVASTMTFAVFNHLVKTPQVLLCAGRKMVKHSTDAIGSVLARAFAGTLRKRHSHHDANASHTGEADDVRGPLGSQLKCHDIFLTPMQCMQAVDTSPRQSWFE